MADPKESTLVSKRLGTFRFVLVASPAYLAQRGRPAHPTDLREHETIGFLSNGAPLPWRFAGSTIPVHGRLHTNSPDVLRDAAVAGFGLVRTFEAHVRKELERGDLVTVLDAYDLPPRPLYALYARQKSSLPKVRVFLDFLLEWLAATSSRPKRPTKKSKRSR